MQSYSFHKLAKFDPLAISFNGVHLNRFNLIKPQDLLHVLPALTFRNSVFYPQCRPINVFCVDLGTNSDYFSIQH